MKTKKILKITLILIIFLNVLSVNVFALGGWGRFLGSSKYMDTDIQLGSHPGAINDSKTVTEAFLGILQVIGSIASVLALVILGCRYMFSSVEEKAQMKGIMIYYIIGAVLVFATSNILSIAYDVITSI